MIEFSTIGCAISGEVATLTLRRPEKLNTLRDQTNIELITALDDIARQPTVKLVVLTGEGRAFSAGYDVSEGEDMPERTPPYWTYHFGLAFNALRRIWTLPQPVIAKVRGACLGGGFALSMACDLTYASEDAFFGDPEIKFGGTGNMFPVLQWVLGMKRLNELMLTGRFIHASEALNLGIVNEVLSADELDQRVDQVVRHMLLLPEGTLAANKRLSRRYYDAMGFAQVIAMAEDACALGLSAAPEGEFTKISKRDGVGAALRWQKKRFDEVGAF
jgi:enoyl-CoA hydratase